MHYFTSIATDLFNSIKDILTENEIRMLKNDDEYSFRQFDEHLLLNNSRKSFIFSLVQIIAGVVFLLLTFLGAEKIAQAEFLKIIGSGVLSAGGLLLFLYYKSELDVHKHDFGKLRVVFWLYWNLFTVGGFFISAGFYHAESSVYIFALFFASVLTVPVFRLSENLIAAAVYLIPCICYGITAKAGAGFYVATVLALAAFIWINALKTDYYAKRWLTKRKLKEASGRSANAARTDSLTGMLNRTGFDEKSRERIEEGHKLAVLMVDIDNFRFYNHKFGISRGDGVLYNICNCIKIISKPVTELAARFGSDEIIMLLEDMDELEVIKFAEQVRSAVETMAIPFGENGIVTVSVGVSMLAEADSEEAFGKLLNEADLQLMIAKSNGRNCIGYRNRAFIQENRRADKN